MEDSVLPVQYVEFQSGSASLVVSRVASTEDKIPMGYQLGRLNFIGLPVW